MNKPRLQYLANFLLRLPPNKFNLYGWRQKSLDDETEEDYDEFDPEQISAYSDASLLDEDCGTTGCAVGWACALPSFNAEGLRWARLTPEYEDAKHEMFWSGWNAVANFFDISYSEAHRLFSSSAYNRDEWSNPLAVAQRIEQFVKES